MYRIRAATFFVAVFCFSLSSYADAPDPDPARFADAIETFVKWDNKNSFPKDAYLFVGSSSVRMWSTATAFPGGPIVNRGFGGSEISDVIHYYDQVIKPYSAAKIFLYAGDNDIGRGKMAAQVFEDYKELVGMIGSGFPNAEVIYISIKPSTLRWEHWPEMAKANRLIQEHTEKHPNLGYADLATPLLDDNGSPKDVFIDDGLHLNEWGYELWQEALAPYLD
jgi:lysophospholipase L1-like esterase